ncbi:hypothetical protein [Dyella sp. RRB7]|uniref:hypothetical protein n=1 Tax=Dyella sp. RRB7 TaxID=2919502 RepID=UPI001FAA1D50|nr:hypothetical protein [Dyella sp. RRB7]
MNDSIQDEWEKLVRQSRKDPAKPPVEREPPPPRRRIKWGLPALLVLSLIALVLRFQGTLNPWPAGPSPDEIKAGQHASLMLAAKAIHDYAVFHGKYPQTVAQVLPLTVNIEYRQTSDGFELKMIGADGEPIIIRGK